MNAFSLAGFALATGGLGGVMAAASEGARSAGGLVIGILPGPKATAANVHVDVAIATGMADARNAIIANTADGFVAVGGSYGTLSEIAFVLKRQKPLACVGSWRVDPAQNHFEAAEDAVESVVAALRGRIPRAHQ